MGLFVFLYTFTFLIHPVINECYFRKSDNFGNINREPA